MPYDNQYFGLKAWAKSTWQGNNENLGAEKLALTSNVYGDVWTPEQQDRLAEWDRIEYKKNLVTTVEKLNQIQSGLGRFPGGVSRLNDEPVNWERLENSPVNQRAEAHNALLDAIDVRQAE
jgi:hypothetical protein